MSGCAVYSWGGSGLARGWEGALIGGVVLGIGLMLAVFAETVHSIISLDYGGGRFFCDLVA